MNLKIVRKPYMACEDVVDLENHMVIGHRFPDGHMVPSHEWLVSQMKILLSLPYIFFGEGEQHEKESNGA